MIAICVCFFVHEQDDNGVWLEDEEQIVTLKANFVISAFGSGLSDNEGSFLISFPILSSSMVPSDLEAGGVALAALTNCNIRSVM